MNLVYGWCVERVEEKKREEWDMMLTQPLPGTETEEPTQWQAEDEGADFMAAMQAHAARTAS